MQAFVLQATDGPGGAVLQDVAIPAPRPGEVRVKLKAASLNHRELKHRIKPVIDKQFPLRAAGEAMAYLETSHQFGKVLLSI